MTLHECVIALVDGALFERPFQQRVGALGQRDHHHPRRADVEAMHDALPLVNAGRGDPETGCRQTAQHGRPGPADGGVRSHARGFVDGDDVVVGVQHRSCRRLSSTRFSGGAALLGKPHFQPRAGGQAVGLSGPGTVDVDGPVLGQRRGGGAGQSQ